jgi:hypothetical protein
MSESHPENRRVLAVSTIPEFAVRATMNSAAPYDHAHK